MSLFSVRRGYTKPSDVFIREQITTEIQNAICTCYDQLEHSLTVSENYELHDYYDEMELYVWTEFLHLRYRYFHKSRELHGVITSYMEDHSNIWYKKLDLIEFTLLYLRALDKKYRERYCFTDSFISRLNYEFKYLHFAYRVIDDKIVEITAEEEIREIEEAIKSSSDNIRMHLSTALELYGKRPDADYRNSIKESISAVEAYCRERTGTKSLGDALNALEGKGVVFPQILKTSFEKLYAYTNQPDTGIRHALMDDEGNYTPKAGEAAFMIVACSAFINYLRKK